MTIAYSHATPRWSWLGNKVDMAYLDQLPYGGFDAELIKAKNTLWVVSKKAAEMLGVSLSKLRDIREDIGYMKDGSGFFYQKERLVEYRELLENKE